MLSIEQSRNHKRGVLVGEKEGKRCKGKEQALAILYDEVFMQPWFVPKSVYLAIRRIIPNIHLMKMRHYFDDYGCLRCGETETIYGSSGFCHACNVVVRSRIMASLKKRLKKSHVKWEETVSEHFFDQMNLAQLILRGTSSCNRRSHSNKDRR